MEKLTPQPQLQKGTYRHYKGEMYEVVDVACHSETLEWMVLYRHPRDEGDTTLWVRPYAMFIEDIEIEGQSTPRFQYVDNA